MKQRATLLLMLVSLSLSIAKSHGSLAIIQNTKQDELPAPVANPATNVTDTKFTANWESVEGATLYLLSVYSYAEDNSRDYFIEDDETTGTSSDIEQLNVDLQYYYTVKAKNSTSLSPESEEIKVEKESEGEVEAPELLEPTNVTDNSFTANWKKVSGTSVYWFYLIETYTATQDQTYYIMDEDFNKITKGTINNPIVGGMEDTLDPYTDVQGWEAMYPLCARGMFGMGSDVGMFGGSAIFSPRMDLSQNGGKFTVEMNALSSNIGDELSVIKESSDAPGTEPLDIQSFTFTKKNQIENFQLEFTHENEFAIGGFNLVFQTSGETTFVDDLKISKELKAGDQFSYNYYAQVGNNYNSNIQSIDIEFDPRPGFTYSYTVVVMKPHPETILEFLGYENRMPVPIYVPVSLEEVKDTNIAAFTKESNLHVVLKENDWIDVYDITGKRIVSKQGNSGTNIIPLPHKGIYIVKAGGKAIKIINGTVTH